MYTIAIFKNNYWELEAKPNILHPIKSEEQARDDPQEQENCFVLLASKRKNSKNPKIN
jgi:hypothetical protein